MAKEQNAGSVVYTVSAEIEPLLIAGKQAIDVLDKLDAAAQQSGKGMDSLDQSTSILDRRSTNWLDMPIQWITNCVN